ncbi:MAG: rRNA pseudouridine synthase [Kiritimatiellae bacterium]|nr:rRNA pseudouridine synthase [Kiritimatiellia bacterium]
MERLQKILAAAGLGSRRACEGLISDGRVTVNGVVMRELGVRADAAKDDIRCDGRPVRSESKFYGLLYKPVGYVCTSADPQGRPRAVDLIPPQIGRVYTVGRLDVSSEGLVLITNDGDFAHRVMHPRHEVAKTYLALVRGRPDRGALARLCSGVELDDGPARADAAHVTGDASGGRSWIELTLHEGRNREVRRMLDAVGYPVERLIRIRIGPVEDDRLRPGKFRRLTPREIEGLSG